MARKLLMQQFARWHIWLAWLVGFPILMWTVTGLVMIARPIEEVRGDAVRAEPLELVAGRYVLPEFDEPVREVQLVQQAIGPVWIVTRADGSRYRHYAPDGSIIPPVIASEAREIAAASYAGQSKLESVGYIPADEVPMELRRPLDTWRLHYADGTNIYVEASTGQVLAVRTGWWRVYDLMWGLHIMDLEGRENSHHPIIVLFAALSVIGSMLGVMLMFRRRKARVKG